MYIKQKPYYIFLCSVLQHALVRYKSLNKTVEFRNDLYVIQRESMIFIAILCLTDDSKITIVASANKCN